MPRDFSRLDRVAELVRKELAQAIHQQIEDPRLGIVTLNEIKLSKDLAHAKVYVSVLSETADPIKSVAVLNEAAGFLRTLLAKRIKIRTTPMLSFIHDERTVQAAKLSKLIDGLSREE